MCCRPEDTGDSRIPLFEGAARVLPSHTAKQDVGPWTFFFLLKNIAWLNRTQSTCYCCSSSSSSCPSLNLTSDSILFPCLVTHSPRAARQEQRFLRVLSVCAWCCRSPNPGREEPTLPSAAAETRVDPLALPQPGSWGSLLRTRVPYTFVTVKTQPKQPTSE